MAVPKAVARAIIIKDGHLALEGDETVNELRLAISFLIRHECERFLHTPAATSLRTHYEFGKAAGRYPNVPSAEMSSIL